MKYQNLEVDILSKRITFGKVVAEIRILATGKIMDVPFADLEEDGQPLDPMRRCYFH